MSLILDALRKLEREKSAGEPNVLVVGSVPWGGRTRSLSLVVWILAAAALVAVGATALWLLRPTPRPVASEPTEAPPAPVVEETPAPAEMASRAPASVPVPAPSVAATPTPTAPPPRSLAIPVPPPASTAPEEPEEPPPPAHAATEVETPSPPRHETLRLTVISERDGRPVALINDRMVFEGDSFDGIEILDIRETEVEVRVHGERRVLRF